MSGAVVYKQAYFSVLLQLHQPLCEQSLGVRNVLDRQVSPTETWPTTNGIRLSLPSMLTQRSTVIRWRDCFPHGTSRPLTPAFCWEGGEKTVSFCWHCKYPPCRTGPKFRRLRNQSSASTALASADSPLTTFPAIAWRSLINICSHPLLALRHGNRAFKQS